MANALYGKFREACLSPGVDLSGSNIKAILVDGASYTPSIDVDQYLSTIAGGAIKATSGNLSGKSVTLGVFDAADVTWTAVAAGAACEYVVLYIDSGVAATSRLIALIDTATGLPVTPNGGDITVAWSNGADKIFKL